MSNDVDWVEVLRAEAERTSVAAVARRLNYSRPAISQILHGRYGASTQKIEEKVRSVLIDQIRLPSGASLSRTEYDTLRAAPMPTNNPKELRLWVEVRDHGEAA